MPTTIRAMLGAAAVFGGLPSDVLDEVARCGALGHFAAGADVFRSGGPANIFYVVRQGRISIQVAAPGAGAAVVRSCGPGDAVGWSWLFPPFRWHFDAVAQEPTRVISLNGRCLREKCASRPGLGYPLMSRFAQLVITDLESTRLQLLDVYGHAATG